jgi:hypothetical protein
MKGFLKELKMLFSLMLLGAIYGGAISAVLALLTGNNALSWAGALSGSWAGALSGAGAWVLALSWVLAFAGVWVVYFGPAWVVVGVVVGVGVGALALGGLLEYLAKRNKTTPEALIENHLAWIFSFPFAIFRLLFGGRSSVKNNQKSKTKQRAWDVNLITIFTQELTEIFPEEWDDWQHWISDMMDSRTRMQSKGMNHRLVSLITFYRLIRFAFHIGIGKVFIIATRRATR